MTLFLYSVLKGQYHFQLCHVLLHVTHVVFVLLCVAMELQHLGLYAFCWCVSTDASGLKNVLAQINNAMQKLI